jgi:hypothetical protein
MRLSVSPARLLCLGLLLFATAAAPRAEEVELLRALKLHDPARREMMDTYRDRLQGLQERVKARQRQGADAPCSTQILLEARWLLNYTNQAERLARTIDSLERSLAVDDQSFANERDEEGAAGRCFTEWFFKLGASLDQLTIALAEGRPRFDHKLTYLDRVRSPERLVAYLKSLLVSEQSIDGVDRRKELNLSVTALAQFLLIPRYEARRRELVEQGWLAPGLPEALTTFLDETWQDAGTGYWGAWYKIDGNLARTRDLSITFHIVSYRDCKVPRLKQIVDTTFDIREQPFPFGWDDRGRQNSHHDYDVVRLMRCGWEVMDADQRARARAEIGIMMARQVRLAIARDGSIRDEGYETVPEAYYFGVSFLDEIGYFRKSRRFWTTRDVPGGEELRARVEQRLLAISSSDPYARAALLKLKAAD